MRWSYKTEHFSLKKEGLLGSAFLDEAEIERSLNEFGKAGWELVSFMEVSDGMIAIFKQPFAQNIPQMQDPFPEKPSVPLEHPQQMEDISPPSQPASRATLESDEKNVGDIKIL